MDKGSRPHGNSSTTSPWSYDPSFEVWQSTPIKNNVGVFPADVSKVSVRYSNEMDGMVRQLARSLPPSPIDIHCHTQLQHTQMSVVSDMETSTIQRQRRELQLLITELKDRDRELNTMAASHHKQLHAWEQDRQRVLSLEKRCARSDEGLQKRVEVIRALTRRVRVVEARENDLQTELSTTQQHLQQLEQEHQDMEQTSQDLQDKNASLNSTVLALSSQVGSLQVREEELRSMRQLKEKDVREAAAHMGDLRGRLQDLEASLKESHSREHRLLRVVEETKRRYREYRHENSSLREELQQHVTQSSAQREEIIRLKQEHQMLCRDLALSGEGDSWKDELLALARSKQERTESELHCLRQVCENQQNDLQLLQLNLETARETLGERSHQESVGREDTVMVSQNILEMSREQPKSPCSQVLSNNLKAKQNIPNVFPSVTTGRKIQRELEDSISGLSLDATVPMTLCELINHSNATCCLFPDQTSKCQQCPPENGIAPNCNACSFHSEPGSYNSSVTSGDQSSSGRSCCIREDADLQSKENVEGKVLGQGHQERSTTETKITAYIQSGCRTSFKPKCDHLEDFILNDDLARQNFQGSTVQPRSQDDSLEEGLVNNFTAAATVDSDEDLTEVQAEGKMATCTEIIEQEQSDFICDRICMGEAEESRPGKMASCGKRSDPQEQAKPYSPATASIAEDAKTFPSSSIEAASSESSIKQMCQVSRQESTWSLENKWDKEQEMSSVGPDSTSKLMSREDERVDMEDSGLSSFESSGHRSRPEQTDDRFESNRTFVQSYSSYEHEKTTQQIRPSSFKIIATGCKSVSGTIHYRRTTDVPTQMGHTGVGGVKGVGEPEPGEGHDTREDVGHGSGMNLVAVLMKAPQGKSSSILSLEVRPRTPQDQDHTCQDDSLTSSLMTRNCCLANNTKQPATALEDPELLSHASNNGRHPSMSCCLQRALDDSKHLMAGLDCSVLKQKDSMKNRNALVSLNLSHSSGSSEAPHCHTCLKSSCYSRSSTDKTDKVTETPPKAGLQHREHKDLD